MRTNKLTFMKRAAIMALLLCAALPLTAATVYPAVVDVYLYAGAVTKTMPDGTPVTMWGFALEPDGAFTTLEGTVGAPGPRLSAAAGDTLNIHLYNSLAEPVSLVIPGQTPQAASLLPTWTDGTTGPRAADIKKRVRSFTYETAPASVKTYSWSNVKPGTYLYQSGTHPAVQLQMGLYGALTVDAASGHAYPAGGEYASEALLLYSEIDPALHSAVAGGTYGASVTSTINYQPQYFLVNGMPFPANSAVPVGDPAGPVLIRFLNAGLKTHVPALENAGYMSVIAEDGNPYTYARSRYSVLLPAGKTADALWTPSSDGDFALYDRRLFLANGPASPGGMVSYLRVSSAAQDTLTTALGVFRNGSWRLDTNGNGVWNEGSDALYSFGSAGHVPVAGDWNGDGETDIGVFRNGVWQLDTNGNGVLEPGTDMEITFGKAGHMPVAGDWNGDGKTDIGVFRNGVWQLDTNGNGVLEPGTDMKIVFGKAGHRPVTGDWNGDGKTDIGVFRNGVWDLDSNGNGVLEPGTDANFLFGLAKDRPVSGEW